MRAPVRRRTYLAAAGGLATLGGGTAAAKATRADVVVESGFHRGAGDSLSIRTTVRRDSVEYFHGTDEVRDGDLREPFERWARREASRVAAERILPAIQERSDVDVSVLGRGVAYLLFGAVVTVQNYPVRSIGDERTSGTVVPLDELVAVTPRRVSVTVTLEGREASRTLPGAVEHGDEPEADRD